MNKSLILRIISLLLVFAFLPLLQSCEADADEFMIYETATQIDNIDPQLADNDTEFEIVYNTFEGLFKYDKNGELQNGVISDYEVSPDNLEYTFNISENAVWYDGTPVTADDFVFAFTRAVDSETEAPYAYTLYPIKNAQKILNGKKSKSTLGVKSISEKKLLIKLEYPDTDFIQLLTTPIAMPCNRKFFEETKGYYGLNAKSILCNGAYYIDSWNDEYSSLEYNKNYTGDSESKIKSVYIYFNDEETLCENIVKKEVDFSILNNSIIDKVASADSSVKTEKINDTSNLFLINPDSVIANTNILNALVSTISFDITDSTKETYGAKRISSITPDIISRNMNSETEKIKSVSVEKAQNQFLKGCSELEVERSFPTFSIICLEDPLNLYVVKQIASNWQDLFGVTVNVESVSSKDMLISRVTSNDYHIALCTTEAISSSASAFFSQFASTSPLNYFNYKNEKFDKGLKKLSATQNSDDDIAKLADYINSSDYIIPLFSSSKLYYFGDKFNFEINESNKIIYFSYCD